MGLFKFIIKKAVPIPKIKDCEAFAFVGPHPDDIEVACGATVKKLTDMGKRVCFIIATDGRCGTQDLTLDQNELIKIRKDEAKAAAKSLGVDDVRFLDFPDGGDYTVEELKNKIAPEFADFKPDMIFTPDNHLKNETHPDHIKCGRATEIAMLTCQFPLMMNTLGSKETASPKGIAYYYTDKPNSFINVSKTFQDRINALKLHESQFLCDEKTKNDFKLMCIYFKLISIKNVMRKFCKYADGYRILSNMHLHCAPEASNL